MAKNRGATIVENQKVIDWSKDGQGYIVRTKEVEYRSKKLVITSGAWVSQLLNDFPIHLKITHQPLAWASQKSANYSLGEMPCFLIEEEKDKVFYGFPDISNEHIEGPKGMKVALHYPGEEVDPDQKEDDMSEPERKMLQQLTKRYIPEASTEFQTAKVCLYTYSPDTDFIIDYLPGHSKNVVLGTGFSGHGFKFPPGIGEALARMIVDRDKDGSIEFLGLKRFQK